MLSNLLPEVTLVFNGGTRREIGPQIQSYCPSQKMNISVVVQRVVAPYVRLFGNKSLSSVLKITTSPLPLRKSTKSKNQKHN